MRIARPRRSREEPERILPLINVVFLLLIFFMIVGRLAAGDPFVVTPPNAAAEDPARTAGHEVLIGADGRLALDGEPVDRDALAGRMRAAFGGPDSPPVRVRADAATPALEVVRVMELLRAAGAPSIELTTVRGTT